MAKQLKYGEEARRALEAGMNAHLAKPIDTAKADLVIAKVIAGA